MIHSFSKINNTPRLCIKLPDFGEDCEIEFFDIQDKGFPSSHFSLANIFNNNLYTYDSFGNPYLNILATVSLYSGATTQNNKIIIGDGVQISLERLNKNIMALSVK